MSQERSTPPYSEYVSDILVHAVAGSIWTTSQYRTRFTVDGRNAMVEAGATIAPTPHDPEDILTG